MKEQPTKQVKLRNPGWGKPTRRVRIYSAQEKVQAVLAVWTERVRPAQVCRQLSINPITFSQWQDRAMEGMLQALESRVNLSKGKALSPRLQKLLNRRVGDKTSAHFYSRLEKIQSSNTEAKATTT